MKTSILKKATLVNKGVWTTTITWATILSENGSTAEAGKTVIITEQKYYRNKENSFTRTEKFEHHEFNKAYDKFHKLLKNWL